MANQISAPGGAFQNNRRDNDSYISEEVNLIDYFRVIYKRKKSIIAIFLVTVIAAVIVNLITSPVFEAVALVKTGAYKNNILEGTADIQAIFASDQILRDIVQKLDLPTETLATSVTELFRIGVDEEYGSGFLEIKGWGNTPEKSVKVVNTITEMLLERHQRLFNEGQRIFEQEVESLKRDKDKTSKEIELMMREIKRLDEDIKYYETEIKRRADVQTEAQGMIVASYISLLANVKDQEENRANQLEGLKQKLADFELTFQKKEYEKQYETRMTAVEIPPAWPKTRIAPARRKNVMTAGILGLLLGILYAFGAEYYSRYKEKMVSG